MTTTLVSPVQKGGAWLFDAPAQENVFTPEMMTGEHRLVDQTALEFVTKEITPNHDQLETKDWDLARRLQRQAGKGLIVTSYGWRRRGLAIICAIVHLITRWRATGEQKFANHRDSASPIGCDTRQAPKYVDDL